MNVGLVVLLFADIIAAIICTIAFPSVWLLAYVGCATLSTAIYAFWPRKTVARAKR